MKSIIVSTFQAPKGAVRRPKLKFRRAGRARPGPDKAYRSTSSASRNDTKERCPDRIVCPLLLMARCNNGAYTESGIPFGARTMERRLSAILAADVVGYSALME